MPEFGVDLTVQPIDLTLCLKSGQVFGWNLLDDGVWRGMSGAHQFSFRSEGNSLWVQSTAESAEVHQLFGLYHDLLTAQRDCLKSDPTLQHAFQSLSGLRLMQPTCLSEVIFTFLCTSNNHLSRIEGMIRRFREINSQWPSPEEIGKVPESLFREWGFGYRGKTIPLVGKELSLLGSDWEALLRTLPYADARIFLQSLPGVGPKLADCIALYGLHHLQAVPVDTHLWQAVTKRYFPQWENLSPTPSRMWDVGEALRDKFGIWAGYVQLILYFDNMQRRKNDPKHR